MDTLNTIVRETVLTYAGGGNNLKTFPFINEDQQAYTVLIVNTPIHRWDANILVFVRVIDDYVVIEADTTDDPIYEALARKGVSREKIILAYAGQALPANLQTTC